MIKRRIRWAPVGAALIAMAMVGSACSGNTESATVTDGYVSPQVEQLTVMRDPDARPFIANIDFTEDGFQPETLFLPAGVMVKLALRNRTAYERHFRVVNLVASDVRWIQIPELDTYDLDSMDPEELDNFGIDPGITDEAELEHEIHHLAATFVPSKQASLHGIKPLPGEVHSYAQRYDSDEMVFVPLRTGRYVVEDVLNPEFTGTVVVFLPEGAEGV